MRPKMKAQRINNQWIVAVWLGTVTRVFRGLSPRQVLIKLKNEGVIE